VVALDAVDNTFNINLEPKATHTAIKIFAQDKAYTLTLSGKYQYCCLKTKLNSMALF
jgi:hypothetical protein